MLAELFERITTLERYLTEEAKRRNTWERSIDLVIIFILLVMLGLVWEKAKGVLL